MKHAFYLFTMGLDPVPPMATRLCGMEPVRAQDGMPVTFSVQIDKETVLPSAFTVKTSTNNPVTPICATLRPADELLEQRTVLLIGSFSPDNSIPVSVEIVDHLRDINGNSLLGLQSQKVTRKFSLRRKLTCRTPPLIILTKHGQL